MRRRLGFSTAREVPTNGNLDLMIGPSTGLGRSLRDPQGENGSLSHLVSAKQSDSVVFCLVLIVYLSY